MPRSPLAPGMAEFVRRSEAAFPTDFLDLPPARQRALYREFCRALDGPRPRGVLVSDESVAADGQTVPVRLYRPAGRGPHPVLLYLHGGGWVLGDLDSHDGITAGLAAAARIAVVAVDYRLAPEHPFPAALEDCAAVLAALAAGPTRFDVDPRRLAVGGDSAGGNLAAALCLRAREAGGPAIAAQLLVYPDLFLRFAADAPGLDPDAPLLSRAEVAAYTRAYLGGATSTADPLAGPLLAGGLSELPPAYVLAAEHDPLLPDSMAYVERLTRAGVAAELDLGHGLVHGFLKARLLSAAAGAAFQRLCAAGRRLIGDA